MIAIASSSVKFVVSKEQARLQTNKFYNKITSLKSVKTDLISGVRIVKYLHGLSLIFSFLNVSSSEVYFSD